MSTTPFIEQGPLFIHQLAILLRGPIGVGKSAVQSALIATLQLPATAAINLDSDWFRRESVRGRARYNDLSARPEPVLIIELACGEPSFIGRPGPGATSAPREWISVLEQDGRRLYAFRLIAPRTTLEHRVRTRPNGENPYSASVQAFIDFYSTDDACQFAARAQIHETTLDTAAMSANEIAEEILRFVISQEQTGGHAEMRVAPGGSV